MGIDHHPARRCSLIPVAMLIIFRNCDLPTLLRLRQVSRAFRELSQSPCIWKSRLPPGFDRFLRPQDLCDAAARHSSTILKAGFQEVEKKTVQVIEDMSWSLEREDLSGRRRRILGIITPSDFDLALRGRNIQVFPVYLSERAGVIHQFVGPLVVDGNGEPEHHIHNVFFDVSSGERFLLRHPFPHPHIWSIPGTNMILNGIIPTRRHMRSFFSAPELKLFQWNEAGKTFERCGDESGLFEPMMEAFRVMPKVVVNSWGVVLSGWDWQGTECTFLAYRVNPDGSGLTFSSGCFWHHECFSDPRKTDDEDKTVQKDWTYLLGSSRLFFGRSDVVTMAITLEACIGDDIECEEQSLDEGTAEEETEQALPWKDQMRYLPYQKGRPNVLLTCGDRLLRYDGDSIHQHDIDSDDQGHQRRLSGLLSTQHILNLAMDPSHLIAGNPYLEKMVTVVDPVTGRVVAFEWADGSLPADHHHHHRVLVVYEEDVGGPLVPRWEQRAAGLMLPMPLLA
ncbi:hypothetical protein HDU67_004273 [Dinochytrium kinnereticum]|nr:hypothetical protein HDU67_004273 [Dinochytrium kinnereticum]